MIRLKERKNKRELFAIKNKLSFLNLILGIVD